MTYLKPAALTRKVINPLVSVLRTGGVATLTVAGRSTGRRRTVPVIPVAVHGKRYLVSPYGESDWVRNLRSAGRGELHGRGERESIKATEVPAAERAPIIASYREIAGRTVEPCFTGMPDPGDHPVFRIE
ncbi:MULTISPECIES: nitroreductase family deazaflavin-dependent oxidoreductase [unclassified Pseudonocardia]|jgi:deazaflavin-dependent oxidoreductase (nitroreductase family)|uniref:nitroreductase family deazaflavin-dependent oxidoreductase n=1 Tax=unclassified Pseudonocardia TaxID=2619320 RepID=UPI00095A606E|nr:MULTISPECIES: nitroreductase family deazaflavin-dependent oxidoreductase [unclassified Pseudonocardia]MBN9101972.1 nitroreductase family deazaflavin-dependent oxidoreductase [Pseudonocardia sp.]OJY47084.1 MAG: hypothetical protein BGP03_11160 [Pseudonocardia sp. 73-21]